MRKLTFPLWRGFIVCLGHCWGGFHSDGNTLFFSASVCVCVRGVEGLCVCVCRMEMDRQNECEQVEAFSWQQTAKLQLYIFFWFLPCCYKISLILLFTFKVQSLWVCNYFYFLYRSYSQSGPFSKKHTENCKFRYLKLGQAVKGQFFYHSSRIFNKLVCFH